MRFMIFDITGNTGGNLVFCSHCGKPLVEEPNTSWLYKWLTFVSKAKKIGWMILEFTHLFRYTSDPRYSMFGDEAHYVKGWVIHNDGREEAMMRKRKWWEYIVIERR